MSKTLLSAAWVLGLAVTAFSQTPSLVLSTSNLTISAIENGPAPASQIFTVQTADGSSISVEPLVDTGVAGTAAPAWITVTPHDANTPAQIEVAANPAGLAPSTYSARIQFTDLMGHALGASTTVTLMVTAGTAHLDVDPSVVNISGAVSKGNLEESLFVRNDGPGTLDPVSATVVSGSPWLSVAPVSTCGDYCAVSVRAAVASLKPGAYSGVVRIGTAIGSQDVPVSLYAAGPGPVIKVYPDGLQFTTVEDTKLIDSRTISFENLGDGEAKWSAAVVEGQSWLSLNTTSGTAAAGSTTKIMASINTGITGMGTYGGLIAITAADSSFTPLYVPVVLRIESGDTLAVPLLSTGGVVLQAALTAEEAQMPVTLSAASANPIAFQVAAQSGGWLSAGPLTGTVVGPTPVSLNIVGAPISLMRGFYSGLVNVAFGTVGLLSMKVGFSVTDTSSCKPQFLYLTETGIPDSFTIRTGYPAFLEAALVDDCGDFISNGSVNATFSNGDQAIALESIGNGYYAATWYPAKASASLPNGIATVSLEGFASNLPSASTEVTGTVIADTAPVVGLDAVLNNLNAQLGAPLAPGTVVQIFGSGFGSGTGSGSLANGQLSTTVNGVTATIGGVAAPLYYTSSGQLDAQVPSDLEAGQQYELVVQVNNLYSNPVTINTVAAEPGLASLADGTVIAQDTGYNLITAANPAHAGQVIILYATGMGATNPAVATGAVAPSSPLAYVVTQPQVTVGGTAAKVLFAGLSPGSVGLYQIDVQVPAGTSAGNLPVVVTQGGVAANAVTVPVQ